MIEINDLDLGHLWALYPGERTYGLTDKITVLPPAAIPLEWNYPKKNTTD
jgi:hypothetical protein